MTSPGNSAELDLYPQTWCLTSEPGRPRARTTSAATFKSFFHILFQCFGRCYRTDRWYTKFKFHPATGSTARFFLKQRLHHPEREWMCPTHRTDQQQSAGTGGIQLGFRQRKYFNNCRCNYKIYLLHSNVRRRISRCKRNESCSYINYQNRI